MLHINIHLHIVSCLGDLAAGGVNGYGAGAAGVIHMQVLFGITGGPFAAILLEHLVKGVIHGAKGAEEPALGVCTGRTHLHRFGLDSQGDGAVFVVLDRQGFYVRIPQAGGYQRLAVQICVFRLIHSRAGRQAGTDFGVADHGVQITVHKLIAAAVNVHIVCAKSLNAQQFVVGKDFVRFFILILGGLFLGGIVGLYIVPYCVRRGVQLPPAYLPFLNGSLAVVTVLAALYAPE